MTIHEVEKDDEEDESVTNSPQKKKSVTDKKFKNSGVKKVHSLEFSYDTQYAKLPIFKVKLSQQR